MANDVQFVDGLPKTEDDVVNSSTLPDSTKFGGMQFRREIVIEIRDYKSRVATYITNDFEIEFSIFKTIDHVKEDDMGGIKVYGLTKERIRSFQESGGEVTIYAGYTYGNQEVVPVFWGYISRLWGTIGRNTTILNIECSANMIDHTFSGTGMSVGGSGVYSFGTYLERVGLDYGYPNVYFDFRSVPKEDLQVVKDFVSGFPFMPPVIGTSQVMFEALETMFGIVVTKKTETSGIRGLNIVFTSKTVDVVKDITNKGYNRVDDAVNKNIENFKLLYEADVNVNTATVLDRYRGLISSSIEYKVVDARADLELGEHETETLESQGKRAKTLAEWVEKEEEARKKAEAKGKEYTPKDPPKSLSKKKVNRKYNKVTALFNPKVLPQSLVIVYDSFEERYSVYRVRSMQIECNNKSGRWIMNLNCEDSRNIALTPEQEEALRKIEEQQAVAEQQAQQPQQPQPVANLKGAGSTRRDQAMRYFMSKGWTKEQSAGIVANLMAESHSYLDHTALGDKGTAYGIAQWRGSRQTTFARVFGKSIKQSSFEEQLAYVDWELRNDYVSVGNRLRNSSTASSATAIITRYYEIPADIPLRISERVPVAEAIVKLY